MTQAIFLAQEIREWTMRLPYVDPNHPTKSPGPDAGEDPNTFVNDLYDLSGATFTPPRDGRGNAIAGLTGWSQSISMEWRQENSLATVYLPRGGSAVVCVTVTIKLNNQTVYTTSWLVTDRTS